MTADDFRNVERHGAGVDLSSRTKLQLTGADRVRYLNGQVTNDVRKASKNEALYACVTNVKGKMEGDVFIHARADALLLDADASLREALAMRLERYIVSDDVELKDVTDEWRLWHFFGAAMEKAMSHAFSKEVSLVKAMRFGVVGVDVWLPADADFPLLDVKILSAGDMEIWRIAQGVPRWSCELNSDVFPPEAGLEEQAMDYTKGCYIGQEILSRIKMTGKMPHQLIRFSATACGEGVPQDWKIFTKNPEGAQKEVGVVTSACVHPVLDRCVGLAYVRQNLEAADSLLLGRGEPTRVFAELTIT